MYCGNFKQREALAITECLKQMRKKKKVFLLELRFEMFIFNLSKRSKRVLNWNIKSGDKTEFLGSFKLLIRNPNRSSAYNHQNGQEIFSHLF